jgi:hypothetical protein
MTMTLARMSSAINDRVLTIDAIGARVPALMPLVMSHRSS